MCPECGNGLSESSCMDCGWYLWSQMSAEEQLDALAHNDDTGYEVEVSDEDALD